MNILLLGGAGFHGSAPVFSPLFPPIYLCPPGLFQSSTLSMGIRPGLKVFYRFPRTFRDNRFFTVTGGTKITVFYLAVYIYAGYHLRKFPAAPYFLPGNFTPEGLFGFGIHRQIEFKKLPLFISLLQNPGL
jgi:hypothetical protein